MRGTSMVHISLYPFLGKGWLTLSPGPDPIPNGIQFGLQCKVFCKSRTHSFREVFAMFGIQNCLGAKVLKTFYNQNVVRKSRFLRWQVFARARAPRWK